MSDKVPYHAYEKRGKIIEERDRRITELEAENANLRVIINGPPGPRSGAIREMKK